MSEQMTSLNVVDGDLDSQNFSNSSWASVVSNPDEEYSLDQKVQTILGMIGSVGNFLLVHCFFRKKPKHPSDYFILAFSVNDLGFCLVMSTLNCFRWVTNQPTLASTEDDNHYRCTANLFVYSVKTMCSLLILAAMTVNRWCAVCRPHYYKHIFSERKVRLVLGVIVMIAVARSLPYVSICWIYPISEHWGERLAEVIKNFVLYGVFLWLKSILVFCDAILMMVAYPLIGWRLRKMTIRRQQTRGIRLASVMATTDVDCTTATMGVDKRGSTVGSKLEVIFPGTSQSSEPKSSQTQASIAPVQKKLLMQKKPAKPDNSNIGSRTLEPCSSRTLQTLSPGSKASLSPGQSLHSPQHQTSSQECHRPSDSTVTATLFLVCFVYMLLMLPDSVLEFCHIYKIGLNVPEAVLVWSQVLFNFYFVINPALYYFSNKYFQCYINNIFRKSAI